MSALDDHIPLINEDGRPFTSGQIASCCRALAALDSDGRREARDYNAEAIASNDASRLLVLSGPGTGKSTLFKMRIGHWLSIYPTHEIRVATFVRKLVADLNSDIEKDDKLTDSEKRRTLVTTLHGMARGIVERSRGTPEIPLAKGCLVINGREWEEMVWEDTLALEGIDAAGFPWQTLLNDLYDAQPPETGDWGRLRARHINLQQFYSALTFPDLILFATRAIGTNPDLVGDTLFIIDEFQDFNTAEERLIRALTRSSPGVLLAGDDDQVLYDTLRSARSEIIKGYYDDTEFANAMLPLCSRCGFHICETAEAFLARESDMPTIKKVFLPLNVDAAANRVNVVAATSPKSGVDYIEQFLIQHDAKIKQRHEDLLAGVEKDPYLLILAQARELNFLQAEARDRLNDLIRGYSSDHNANSSDYWRVRDYYFGRGRQNFSLRKVLAHEQIDRDTVTELLTLAMATGTSLVDIDHEAIHRCLSMCDRIREIVATQPDPQAQATAIVALDVASDAEALARDLKKLPLGGQADDHGDIEYPDQATVIGAVTRTTIFGAKGLSADHVMVLGCDDVNLAKVSRCAFFVALTRARISLTLLACIGGGGASTLHPFILSLPDANTNVLYAKKDETLQFGSVTQLEGHLRKWAGQRARSKKSKAKHR